MTAPSDATPQAPPSRVWRVVRGLLALVWSRTLTAAGRKAVDAQKEKWETLARELFDRWRAENQVLVRAKQGFAVRMSYDLARGAVYAELFCFPHDSASGLFLFGATLDQKEASALVAARHFDLLTSALRRIWRADGPGGGAGEPCCPGAAPG